MSLPFTLFNFYRQTVKPITIMTTTTGGLYGYSATKEQSKVMKYARVGLLCGVFYPVSLSLYTVELVKECIRNPYYPSTDVPIL